MKMKSLAPTDVWPQSLTNGFLALRKSGTYWIRHTPILSSTDWFTKKEICVVVWFYLRTKTRCLDENEEKHGRKENPERKIKEKPLWHL